jgi:hypothetical protein
MTWTVTLRESVIEDLRWFGKKHGRLLLNETTERLMSDPLAETRQMKRGNSLIVQGEEFVDHESHPSE